MRQVWITRHGPPEVLEVREKEPPPLRPGEVTVAVRAAGINFADLLARKGLYADAPKPPCVVGYEISGIVEAVGERVDPGWRGREVLAFTRFGGYSERVNLLPEQLFEKPGSISFGEAAALLVNYLTAFQLVVVMGGLRKGETVLIHNAGGGVGMAALQLARHLGAVTIGTASAGKHAFLKEAGLDHAVDYRRGDWEKEVRDRTGGLGVELILDPIGGSAWRKNYRLLRPTGRMGIFGISSAVEAGMGRIAAYLKTMFRIPLYNPVTLMGENRGVFGVNLGHLWKEGGKVREWTAEILEGVRAGFLRPHVDRSFPFSEAAAAHRHIEERRNLGKVILVP